MIEYMVCLFVFTLPVILYGFTRKEFRGTLLKIGFLGTVSGAIWDYIAVNILQLWFFNPKTVVGIWFLGLPLEEWLFIPLVSMSVSTLALSFHLRKSEKI